MKMIDLLLGGSPCQGFSFAGKQLNFFDPRSKLFFDYVKALETLKPKYFLLENVKMKKEYQDIISKYVGVEPIEINSALLSAQNRKRLYWTNIPNISQPQNKNIFLKDILQEENIGDEYYLDNRKGSINYTVKKYNQFFEKHGYIPKYFNPYNCCEIHEKSPTLTAVGARVGCSSTVIITQEDGRKRQLTNIEWERLQTLPDNYTNTIPLSDRFNCIGNGWTVDVIAHILSFIPEKYLHTVVSLFDGISCGQVALERAGKTYNQYYASEIDKYAIQIAKKNYCDTIQLGDITQIDWNEFMYNIDSQGGVA